MPRIGMLIARFHPVEGGAEIQCRRLALALKKKDCDVFVLTQKLPELPPFEILDGIPVYRFSAPSPDRSGSLGYIISGFFWLLRNREKVRVLQAHIASAPAVLGALASKALGLPVILKIEGTRATGDIGTSSRTLFGRMKLGFLKRTIDVFVCPSSEAREELVKAGFPADRIVRILNGVPTDTFAPLSESGKPALRMKLGLPEKGPVVLYAGRFEPGKGLEVLLEAWPSVAVERNAQLILLGGGSLEGKLKTAASRLRNVHFPGWKENASEYLQAADVFVLPSFGEGLPISLLEAMSCGLACISTRIGGVTDLIVPGQNGVLVEPGDRADLALQIDALTGDPSLRARLGAAAREYITKNASMETVADRYAELYRTLQEKRDAR